MQLNDNQIKFIIERQKVYAKLDAIYSLLDELEDATLGLIGDTKDALTEKLLDKVGDLAGSYRIDMLPLVSKYAADTAKIIQTIEP